MSKLMIPPWYSLKPCTRYPGWMRRKHWSSLKWPDLSLDLNLSQHQWKETCRPQGGVCSSWEAPEFKDAKSTFWFNKFIWVSTEYYTHLLCWPFSINEVFRRVENRQFRILTFCDVTKGWIYILNRDMIPGSHTLQKLLQKPGLYSSPLFVF